MLCRDASYSSGTDIGPSRNEKLIEEGGNTEDEGRGPAPPAAYTPPMTIVTSPHRRKRPQRPAQAATIAVPRIVQQTPRGRAWKPLANDPKADASVAAFFQAAAAPTLTVSLDGAAGVARGGVTATGAAATALSRASRAASYILYPTSGYALSVALRPSSRSSAAGFAAGAAARPSCASGRDARLHRPTARAAQAGALSRSLPWRRIRLQQCAPMGPVIQELR
jgi:hypothetical protein